MRIVGIATFSVFVERSRHRITCNFSGLSPIQDAGHRTQETAPGLVLRAAGLGSLAQSGSGERNTAPAWCSSSRHGASLKQKPPTRAQNRRKLASLGVQGRIIFHGPLQQLMHGRFFFQSGPACGHRCQQLLPDRGCRGRRLLVDLSCR